MDSFIKILLVEDLPSDAHLAEYEIAKSLKRYKLKVVETRDEFTESLDTFAPDLVVSDFQLPSFDGLSALRIVQSKTPVTPVIILTGSMNEDTAVECMKSGAIDYVIKEHIKRLGPAIINALRQKDINIKQIESQRKLEESELKFRNIFQYHAAVKLIIDAESGKIVEANDSAANFYGWSKEELEEMNINQINTLPANQLFNEISNARNLKDIHFEFKHRKANGEIVEVEVFSSKVVINGKDYLHSIIMDISEKKRNEQKIKLLSRAVEQSPISVIITDSSGKIEYLNDSFSRIFGYKNDECTGKDINFLKSGIHHTEFYTSMWNTLLEGKDWESEICNKKSNGELIWNQARISPITNDSGVVTHFVELLEDITEKRRMIEELVAAKERAEENERLKTAFLQNMSHEIRTPMNGILGFLELMSENGIDEDLRSEYLSVVKFSAQRLLGSINNILEISKIETGTSNLNISSVNLEEIMNYFYCFFKQKTDEKGIELKLSKQLKAEASMIYTDKYKIESIISNLINNAIKFTERGSVEFGNFIEDGNLVIFVTDTGIGIPEDRINSVFDRFIQANVTITRPQEGVGLGLSIVKAYSEALGGRISVKSVFGSGSEFYIKIPYKPVNS